MGSNPLKKHFFLIQFVKVEDKYVKRRCGRKVKDKHVKRRCGSVEPVTLSNLRHPLSTATAKI